MKKKNILLGLSALTLALGLASCADKEESKTSTVAATTTETSTTAAPTAQEDDVLTHAEYLAAPEKTTVTIQATISGRQTWYKDAATLYLCDKDGGYFIYSLPCTQDDYNNKLTVGTTIQVTGYKTSWAGEVEIAGNQTGAEATWKVVEGAEKFTATAKDLTNVAKDDLIKYQNDFVKFDNLTVAGMEYVVDNTTTTLPFFYKYNNSGAAGSNCDLYFDLTRGEDKFTFVVESYFETTGEGSELYTAVTSLNVGDKINVEGFLFWYEGAQLHTTNLTKVAA